MRLVCLLAFCVPAPALAFDLAPCYHAGGNLVVPVESKPAWKQEVRATVIDDARLVWYSGNRPVPENDLTVVVLEDCAVGTDLVMYTPQHDPEQPFLDLVMGVFAQDPTADTEAVVDVISLNSNATWTRNAMTGTCVCDAHADNMAGRK